MRVVLVTLRPGPLEPPENPAAPTGRIGRALMRLMGIGPVQYLQCMKRVSLSAADNALRADAEAQRTARLLLPLLVDCTVIMLGDEVAQAFGVEPVAYRIGEWAVYPRQDMQFMFVVIPKPTSSNRFYGILERRQVIERSLKSVVLHQRATSYDDEHLPDLDAAEPIALFRRRAREKSASRLEFDGSDDDSVSKDPSEVSGLQILSVDDYGFETDQEARLGGEVD